MAQANKCVTPRLEVLNMVNQVDVWLHAPFRVHPRPDLLHVALSGVLCAGLTMLLIHA